MRTNRQMKILQRKRVIGSVVLTFVQIARLLNPRFHDLTNQTFGGVRVVGYAGTTIDRQTRQWRVRCSRCGGFKIMLAATLLRKRPPQSCGCARYSGCSRRLRTLYYIEREMGSQAMAGLGRLAIGDKAAEIMADIFPSGMPAVGADTSRTGSCQTCHKRDARYKRRDAAQ